MTTQPSLCPSDSLILSFAYCSWIASKKPLDKALENFNMYILYMGHVPQYLPSIYPSSRLEPLLFISHMTIKNNCPSSNFHLFALHCFNGAQQLDVCHDLYPWGCEASQHVET